MCDIPSVLKRLVVLRFDGLLEKGIHDVMHFPGTSKLEWAVLLTDIQRAVPNISTKTLLLHSTVLVRFLQLLMDKFIGSNLKHKIDPKWVYRMVPSIDDKTLAQ